jgi:predicted DCC family thiol-disulfide oxidoreductase YuxK
MTDAVLLYDGSCGFCAASVRFVLRRDRRSTLRFAPLDGEFGRAVRSRHKELALVDSVVWVEAETRDHPERVRVRSAAALEVARYLGGVWRLALVARLVPGRLRDAVYDVIARHRHHLPGTTAVCLVPPPEARARFLL